MNQRRLAEAISAARSRLDTMRAAVARGISPGLDDEALLAELLHVFDEFASAEEQLHDQGEHLAAARAALEGRFHRYQDLFEFMPDGYLVTDQAGVIREANRAAIALLAATRQGVIGRSIVRFAAPLDRGLVRHQLLVARRATTFHPAEFEVTLLPLDRPPAPAALTIGAVRGEDDRTCGFRILLRDISERRKSEEAEKAASAAQAANAAKDEFLATLSHELRNPLNAIIGWSGILRSETLAGDQHTLALETIDRNAHQLNRLVGDLLDVSRIAQRKLLFEPQACDLVAVVASAIDAVRTELARREQHLRVKMHDPGTIVADPTRLQQLLSNLLGNAVKFTPSGGAIDLRIDVHDGEIEIVVHDSGIGIEPELLPQVFDRFRQGDSAPTEKGGGLGLGLPIARTLARMHGGDLWADSPGAGGGSTFTVRLPLRRDVEDPATGARPAPRWPAFVPGADRLRLLRGFQALIVCADRRMATLVARSLDVAGATVKTVSSLADAPGDRDAWQPDALVVVVARAQLGMRMLADATALEKRRNGALPFLVMTPSSVAARRWLALPAEVGLCTGRDLDPSLLPSRLAVLAQVSGWGTSAS